MDYDQWCKHLQSIIFTCKFSFPGSLNNFFGVPFFNMIFENLDKNVFTSRWVLVQISARKKLLSLKPLARRARLQTLNKITIKLDRKYSSKIIFKNSRPEKNHVSYILFIFLRFLFNSDVMELFSKLWKINYENYCLQSSAIMSQASGSP